MKCAWLNRSYETGPFSGHLFRAVQFYSDTNSWPVPNSFLLCHPWMQFAERVLFYLLFKFFKKFTFIFQLHNAACGILAHQRGIKPMPPALEAWSLKHWSTREVPERILFLKSLIINCVIWKRKFENLLDAKKSFIL